MALVFEVIGFALFLFWLLLIARIVVEFIRSFSRDWHPRGVTVVILEAIMTVTDPPVNLLRRVIPQLTIGSVRLDFSIMVLLLLAFIGMQLAFGAAA
ncbi:MAG: YggT family protein [Mycobacteriaceae bacterium]